jgi:hypothetical protein
MARHLNPPNRLSHVCNAGLTRLPNVKVEIHHLCTLPTSSLQTSSPTSGGPSDPSGSFEAYQCMFSEMSLIYKCEMFVVYNICKFCGCPRVMFRYTITNSF